MIILIFFLFYCVDLSCADNVVVLSDYISAVDNFLKCGRIQDAPTQFFGSIDTFHKTFRHSSPGEQHDLVKALILRERSLTKLSEEAIFDEAKKMRQSTALEHSRMRQSYKSRLALYVREPDVKWEDVVFDITINFYHRLITHSINPDDQLYYQIEYIKNLKISLNVKSYLIMSLVDNVQSPLFAEQGKEMPQGVFFRIAHYYDETITQELIKSYFQLKNNFEQKLHRNNLNYISSVQIIEKQKIFLMTIAYLRGFFAHSSFVMFAKDGDKDCGNYLIDVFKVNTEEKYGAMNAIMLLNQNSDALTTRTINRLYPSQNNVVEVPGEVDEITIEKKNQLNEQPPQQQKKFILMSVISLIFYFLKMIYKYCCSFWAITNDVPTNQNDVSLEVQHSQDLPTNQNHVSAQTKHPSVSDQQYEKIKLQIVDFKDCKNDNDKFKLFLSSLYTNKNYYIDYDPSWFKYWHVKEALVADLLSIRIRILVGYDKLENITQQEPCYDTKSREVYVWTDNITYHDSELIPLYCYALMAKALRFENRYFKLNSNHIDYLEALRDKFDVYKTNWIKVYNKKD